MVERTYIAIDLKSFYASVECIERGLDPMNTNLVVADESRTEKTICLAVSPSLKSFGVRGRPRLFEVIQQVKTVNRERQLSAPNQTFTGVSHTYSELMEHPEWGLSYIIAPPQMALYMEYSTRIYNVYLKYIAPEDIHVYSIDEVFMDVTGYLKTYQMTAHELTMKIIHDVLNTTGITATAGIGTNLYLCKIAMDIVAKRIPADKDGVRIAELDEMEYRKLLWNHKPLTDFWRVGKGYRKKLEEQGLYTMGDIARCSLGQANEYYNEDLLYKMFGINAELLIDHAWGWEPCTIADIKAYKPSKNSIGSGQVLQFPYEYKKARLVVKEMADLLSLDLVDRGLVTSQLVLTVGYDIENLTNPTIAEHYHQEVTTDAYGRKLPKPAHGTANLKQKTASTRMITDAVMKLFDRIVDHSLFVRRVYLVANDVVLKETGVHQQEFEQMDLFTNYEELQKQQKKENEELEKEHRIQHTILDIKKKYGKNAIIKGMNLEEGATTISRNGQIGGHKS